MPLLEIKNLSFKYNGHIVLDAVSLNVGKGESWAVIGKNGAGKSTLVKCIGRLIPVPRSSVVFEGRDINTFAPRELARSMSYVPQASGRVLPSFTVDNYVMMGRFPYQGFMAIPDENDRAIVDSSLELTDTTHLKERIMTTLSGGELQRVFIAGAVAQRTELLLLDEPATFLDPLHQELVRKALQRIHNEFGTTIITVTHDVNAALTRYTHVLALCNGKVYFAGPCSEFSKGLPSNLYEIFSLHFDQVTAADGRQLIVPGVLS